MDLLKKLKALIAKGFATAEEKSAILALVKELPADEQETIKEETDQVEKLPEEAPADSAEDDAEDEEAAKSIIKKLTAEIKTQVGAAKAEMEKELTAWQKKLETKSVKTASIMSLVDNEKIVAAAKEIKSNQKTSVSIELKDFDFSLRTKASVPGDMSIADDYNGTVALSDLEAGVSRSPQRQPFIEQLVSVGSINSMLDVWIEVVAETGEPLPKAELAALPQKEFDFSERSAQVRKIGVYSKYSSEMAEDLPNLISEVRNFLISDLRLAVDSQILTGNGSGENLVGILQNAETWAAGDFASSVLEANRFDVIETAVTQVLVNLFVPNYIVVHPVDKAKMNLAKASDGHYVMPPFISADGQVISGVRVISNVGITAGTFLVGDFTRSSVKYRRGLTVEVTNTDQDDFIKDRFTVKATVRLVHRVKANDYGAFVKGSFATAIAALDSGS